MDASWGHLARLLGPSWVLKIHQETANGFRDFSDEKVVRFHMFSEHRILKLLKTHCVWQDFDMRARRPRACALRLIFCKGWWPSQARNRCWRSSKHLKK
jgi:hypothetical protein